MQRTRSGGLIQPTVLATPMSLWENAGNLTATQATLAVNARDYSSVWTDLTDAKTIKVDIPNDVTGCEMRWQTDANADAHEVEMWIAAGATYYDGMTEDSFMLGGIQALTGGQQVGPNANVFVDTNVVTEYVINNGGVVDSAADRVAVYKVDLRGIKKLVFIATTFEAATTLRLDIRWY